MRLTKKQSELIIKEIYQAVPDTFQIM